MNIIEALTLAKEQGKKVRPVGETDVCLVYIKSRDKFDMRNIETNKYVNTFDGATIKGIFADWEVVKEYLKTEINMEEKKVALIEANLLGEVIRSLENYRKDIYAAYENEELDEADEEREDIIKGTVKFAFADLSKEEK